MRIVVRAAASVIVSAAVALAATVVATAAVRAYRTFKEWGHEPDETARPLPGDDLVGAPDAQDTRGITIDAPPDAVWPWLVQMGYERAGWYSIDALDQKGHSAETIVEAWQGLKVGDVMPTHPGGGFEVKVIDPGRALVLYLDTALVKAQEAAAKAAGTGLETGTVGIQASGKVLEAAVPEFAASWAFVLEPQSGGRTRLIERFRVGCPDAGPAGAVGLPALGIGVFVMTYRQMLGIRERAERLEQGRVARVPHEVPPSPEPSAPGPAEPTLPLPEASPAG